MKLQYARWTEQVNLLGVQCDCGRLFEARIDRWMVVCPYCKRREKVETIREQPLPAREE